ncbi:hypothetical protein QBC35DRAFT_445397 [Podospora australis]|uniref:BTB domain-containing protein n=1 Tax=Podospora australis TaxID=1536484 RepID=A0AAN6WIB1_9PEZI|nr:hypothetical protein QBC35DRAFT_445397 [Podospora australis]
MDILAPLSLIVLKVDSTDGKQEKSLVFRVDLILMREASPVWAEVFDGKWARSMYPRGDFSVIPVKEDYPGAFAILVYIAHLAHDRIPKGRIDGELLYQIVVLARKYDMLPRTSRSLKSWVQLFKKHKDEDELDLNKTAYLGWYLGDEEIFADACERIVWHTKQFYDGDSWRHNGENTLAAAIENVVELRSSLMCAMLDHFHKFGAALNKAIRDQSARPMCRHVMCALRGGPQERKACDKRLMNEINRVLGAANDEDSIMHAVIRETDESLHEYCADQLAKILFDRDHDMDTRPGHHKWCSVRSRFKEYFNQVHKDSQWTYKLNEGEMKHMECQRKFVFKREREPNVAIGYYR